MIEIISIEDTTKKTVETATQKPARKKVIRQFLADHYSLDSILKKVNEKATKLRPKKTQKPQTAPNTTHNPAPTRIAPKPTKPAPTHSRTSEKIWNFLQLISTTAVIFAIAFVAMNWSAYQVIFEKRIGDILGTTDNSELVKIASDRQITQDLLPQATSLESAKSKIPPLDLEIAPPDTRIIIPSINTNVPVIPVSSRNLIRRDWSALENDIQEALRSGVVHYPGTALPGEDGNTVITGHSSYFPWDPGRFKDVFALLHDLNNKDRIVVYHNQRKYVYEVSNIKVVLPEQVEVLNQQGDERLTLLTCTPIGTNLKRLIIEASPV